MKALKFIEKSPSMKKIHFLQKSKILASILCVLIVHLSFGQSSLGYGFRARSMAGTGTAIIENSLSGNLNPGGQVFLEPRTSLGLDVMAPKSSYSVIGEPSSFDPSLSSQWPLGLKPGKVEANSKRILFGHLAFNFNIKENNSLGIFIYGNAERGKSYETKTYYSETIADFGSSEGFINPMGVVTEPTFMELGQTFLALTYSRKINKKLGIGISLIGSAQSFSIGGLEAFGSLHYSEHPHMVSTNGFENAFGLGGKIGLQWNATEKFQAGFTYQSKIFMSRYDSYKGFISESGKLDIPSEWSLGLAYHPFERLLLALDVQRICYSRVPAWGLAMKQNDVVSLGGENGGGFGRKDQMNYKFGLQYSIPKWQFRGGFQHSDVVLVAPEFLLNILMPDVISDYVSLGFSRDLGKQNLSFALVRGLKNSLTGLNGLDPQQYIELTSELWMIELGVDF